jgi:hypothetical protein
MPEAAIMNKEVEEARSRRRRNAQVVAARFETAARLDRAVRPGRPRAGLVDNETGELLRACRRPRRPTTSRPPSPLPSPDRRHLWDMGR